jgi:hypothetical protein
MKKMNKANETKIRERYNEREVSWNEIKEREVESN